MHASLGAMRASEGSAFLWPAVARASVSPLWPGGGASLTDPVYYFVCVSYDLCCCEFQVNNKSNLVLTQHTFFCTIFFPLNSLPQLHVGGVSAKNIQSPF